jgi:hypothetical protein
MEDGSQLSAVETRLDLLCAAHHPEPAFGFQLEKSRHQLVGEVLGVVRVERRSVRDHVAVLSNG